MGICSESNRRKKPVDQQIYKSSNSGNTTSNKVDSSNNYNKFITNSSQTISNKSTNYKALMSK